MRFRHALQHIILGGTVILIGIIVVLTMRHIPVPILSDLPILEYVLISNKTNLPVPFTSQAPAENWSEPWQNACEETAIVMVNEFYKGSSLYRDKSIDEITEILSLKESLFGISKNESMETMAVVIREAQLTWTARVISNPTLDDMRNELAEQRPIIIPVDARLLVNPYYNNITPDYHVMVISGYDDSEKKFIVQDPGTTKGHNFTYGYDALLRANHDYVEPNLRQGPKNVIFTLPLKTMNQ